MTTQHLIGLTPDELQQVARRLGFPAFVGKQIADWLYKKHVEGIDEMSNLSKKVRATLQSEGYAVGARKPVKCQRSKDGTVKYLFPTAYHRTLLMHASVTMADGKGYLFLGKSGTGKSTHSGLWLRHIPNTELLNDDNPAVRIDDEGRAMVYGTPWSGKTPCYKNKSLPIGAIVRLEQAPRNEINRLSPLHAFSSVLSSCSSMIWDKPSFDAITRTSEAVVKRVSVFFLRCLPDEAAARLCHETVANHTSEKTDAQ